MLITFLTTASKVSARSQNTSKPITATINPTTVQKDTQQTAEKTILEHFGKSLDSSIGILNIVATLMSVLVGLITIVIALATALGFFEYRRWKSLRKDAEKHVKEIEELEVITKPIVERIKKIEEEANQYRANIGTSSLTETPSEDLKKKLDEYGKKIELLEAFGMPLKPEDYFNHGIDLYYKGKYELALKAFDKTIELKPDFADAWSIKGTVLGQLGKYADALQAINKAIELKPAFAEAWYNKGIILGKLGRYNEGLQAINKAIELNPNLLVNAWYNRACIYALMKDKQNALTDLSKAIKLDSKYKEKAKHDKDFKDFWNDKEFKQIVGG